MEVCLGIVLTRPCNCSLSRTVRGGAFFFSTFFSVVISRPVGLGRR